MTFLISKANTLTMKTCHTSNTCRIWGESTTNWRRWATTEKGLKTKNLDRTLINQLKEAPLSNKRSKTSRKRTTSTIRMKMMSLCTKTSTVSSSSIWIRTNTTSTTTTMMTLVTTASTLQWTSPSFKTPSTLGRAPTPIWVRALATSNLSWLLTECLTKGRECPRSITMNMEMTIPLILRMALCYWVWAPTFQTQSRRRA